MKIAGLINNDINIFTNDLIYIFKKSWYINNEFGLSIYRTPQEEKIGLLKMTTGEKTKFHIYKFRFKYTFWILKAEVEERVGLLEELKAQERDLVAAKTAVFP